MHTAQSFLRSYYFLSKSRNYPCFTESRSSQKPATCPKPEPDQFSPCLPTSNL